VRAGPACIVVLATVSDVRQQQHALRICTYCMKVKVKVKVEAAGDM
jgi:hypothetical protein